MRLILIALIFMPSIILAHNDVWQKYESEVKRLASLNLDRYFLKDYDFEASKRTTTKFQCPALPSIYEKPTSVHQLRPSDIQVVGAIGDSLTAANGAGASNVLELLKEYRGVSWGIGGDADLNSVITLPNMLKRFNPNVKGFSVGVGNFNSEGANFNVGQPGHTSHDIYEQARVLVERIRNSDEIDFNQDWKMINIFIGGNDVCNSCDPKYAGYFTATRYINNLRSTLDYLKATMPRTLVNLVMALDVTGVSLFESTGFFCKLLTSAFCNCALEPKYREGVLAMTRAIQKDTETLVSSGRYEKDDFTVVLQPFMKNMSPPKNEQGAYDLTYFAPDCFHLSTKGHATVALELWNNMFEKVGSKSDTWIQFQPNRSIKCPSIDEPFIFTSKNSN